MDEAGWYEYSSLTRRLQGRYLYPFILVILLVTALIWAGGSGGSSKNSSPWQHQVQQQQQQQQPKAFTNDPVLEQITKLENCTLPTSPTPRTGTSWTTKPLFVAGYTASSSFEAKGEGDLMKPIMWQLTGNQQGARNYHASSPGMKRCHTASNETVTCSQGHPITPIAPERLTNKFDSRVIFTIQNFVMAFPMGASIKSNRYSNTHGQMNLETWRQTREVYLEQAFPKWKNVITTWKNLKSYYNISMYLSYEHLMDAEKGPLAIQRLSKVLESAGFAVVLSATSEEIADGDVHQEEDDSTLLSWQCIWKNAVQHAVQFQKDYIHYIPPYTAKQRDYVLQQMQQLIDEMMTIENDTELVNILKDYYAEIRDFTPIDDENVQ